MLPRFPIHVCSKLLNFEPQLAARFAGNSSERGEIGQ